MLPDIYIKIEKLAVGTCGRRNIERKKDYRKFSLSVVTVAVNNVLVEAFEK